VSSLLAVARVLPSGDHATDCTVSVWPVRGWPAAVGHDQGAHAAAAAAQRARQDGDQHAAAAAAATDRAAQLDQQAARLRNLLTRHALTRQADQARADAARHAQARRQALTAAGRYADTAAGHADAATALRAILAPGEDDAQGLDRIRAHAHDDAEHDLTRARTRLDTYQAETTHRATQPASTRALEDQARAAIHRPTQAAAVRGVPGRPPAPYRPPTPPPRSPGRGR
jgi:hypothetical protein